MYASARKKKLKDAGMWGCAKVLEEMLCSAVQIGKCCSVSLSGRWQKGQWERGLPNRDVVHHA